MIRIAASHLQILGRSIRHRLRFDSPWRVSIVRWAAKRHRKVAIVISLSLHGLLFAFLLLGVASSISGGKGGSASRSGAGAEGVSGVSVELVSIDDILPDALKVEPAESVELTDEAMPELANATATMPLANIPMVETSTVTTAETGSAGDAPSPNAAVTGATGAGAQPVGLNNALWKQIEPCWHRVATPGANDITLRVSFSPLGNIAQTADASNVPATTEAQSQAEAVQALAECGPYVGYGSQENVVIIFPSRP